ncbi:MAG: hypothetical protein LWX70_13440, partial [Sphingobacteriia bacterium]|nr:hypothetical protein [Sphingobacteriia bacterium]
MEIHSRQQFRLWLAEHFLDRNGVWVIFSKGNVSNTLRASEALEEALCFGWIDGQIRPIDEVKYMKYFAPRGEKSTWSERNKKLAEKLVGAGLFTEYGVSVMERSKNNGSWDHKEKSINLDSMVNTLAEKL